ncbi:hypothetical protein SLA2020_388810 [Shorea laevis]
MDSAKRETHQTSLARVSHHADVLSFPGLNTLGVSLIRADLAIGGVIPPHTHPRATEAVLVASGHILVGLVTTGNVYYSKVLTAGQLFIIPRGLVHFQRNVGPGKPFLHLLQQSITRDCYRPNKSLWYNTIDS